MIDQLSFEILIMGALLLSTITPIVLIYLLAADWRKNTLW